MTDSKSSINRCSTTLVIWVGAIPETLTVRNIDGAEVFCEAGLDIRKIRDSEARFNVAEMAHRRHQCVQRIGDPAFELSVPSYHSYTNFHVLGSAILHEGLERLVRLSRLENNVADLELRPLPGSDSP